MKKQEVMELTRVFTASLKESGTDERRSFLNAYRIMCRELYRSGFITQGQRTFIVGNSLKESGICSGNYFVVWARKYIY